MKVQKLLDALALGPGGVQINLTETGATVSTRYHPSVTGRGRTIEEAAIKVAKVLSLRRRPCPIIQQAVREYEEHMTLPIGRP